MSTMAQLVHDIENGQYDACFEKLYGAGRVAQQRARYVEAAHSFEAYYGKERQVNLYSTAGRSEIGGNHTDHNNGLVMAAAIDLDIIAVVAKRENKTARVRSKGFDLEDVVDLESLAPCFSELERSSSLIRGVASGIAQRGGAIGGFDAYTTSDILKGSGLSSSAAFEVCLGTIINHEFNGGRFTPIELGIIGQYAENTYFGKPSGLMDQLACAVGGAITIDFKDTANPVVEQIPVDLERHGHKMVITDTRGSHADLTADYAAIRAEMEQVAGALGQKVLRDVTPDAFYTAIPQLREQCGDRAVLRSIHFYEECKRVPLLAQALRDGSFGQFLSLINAGGHSSCELNQNAYSLSNPRQQGVPLALAISARALAGQGGVRLQGGGFAGTIQAFVPQELVEKYKNELERIFGAGACYVLNIRPVGCTPVLPG